MTGLGVTLGACKRKERPDGGVETSQEVKVTTTVLLPCPPLESFTQGSGGLCRSSAFLNLGGLLLPLESSSLLLGPTPPSLPLRARIRSVCHPVLSAPKLPLSPRSLLFSILMLSVNSEERILTNLKIHTEESLTEPVPVLVTKKWISY